jgi:ABC-type oligopeptide transport system substrate-binding subunit
VIGLPAEDEMTEEEALRIVRSVNAAERTEVSLLYCSDTWIRGQEAYYLADFLNELGFACVLNPKREAEYVKALRNGDFDLAIMRSSLRSVSDLYELCSSSGSENVFKFTDPEVDTDLQLLMIEDPDLQQEAAGPLASALDANPPFLPIGYEQSVVYLRQGNLSSLHPLPDAPYGNPKDWIPAES